MARVEIMSSRREAAARGRPRQILPAIAAVLLCAATSLAQTKAAPGPTTDKTIPVAKGSRLAVSNDAGEVVIKTWNQESLRVRASHSDRVSVDIQNAASVISIRSRATQGRPTVDYEITAPAWLPIRVSGQFPYIGVEGSQNEVSAETVRGDIVIKGGSGAVTAKSIHGEIIIEDARGRVSATTVNEGIRIAGTTGEIVAETTNGDIVLERIGSGMIDISTVNGDVRAETMLPAGATVRVETHNGDITMIVPETSDATFTVRTHSGDFYSNLPTKSVGEPRRGRRTIYTLGSGGADVELQSFGGTIRLRRPGTAPAPRGKDPKDKEKGKLPPDDAFGTPLSGSEQPAGGIKR
jgi:DUF4097 and DUF4098 domain-containing protein YvlB